jgi:formylglycine-generating enzyme required for sulfatase activity
VSGATIPLLIASEGALGIDNAAGKLWGTSTSGGNTIGNVASDAEATLAGAFPKGFAAFYCQKYEITQQQYVDFLNTLTQTQANNCKYTGSSDRYAISGTLVGSYATTNPYVACNYLSWMDGAAYSDWAGLRPMTELEFEKACRGTVASVAGEYAWGNTTATAATGISNGGLANETPSNSGANAVYGNSGTGGPLRVGAFANGSSTRAQSGASYYGIMELSCNLFERVVTVGNASGRAFTGEHGDGTLSANGHANETFWPGFNSGEVTGVSGSGFRGGVWGDGTAEMRVSDRKYARETLTWREGGYGFRAIRVP